MAYVFWMLIKKRWYIFLTLGLFSLVETLLSWNNTNLFIEQLPQLMAIQEKSSDEIYDVFVMPQAEADGRLITNTPEEQQQLITLFQKTFFEDQTTARLFTRKRRYFDSHQTIADLPALSETALSEALADDLFNPEFYDDLLVTNIDRVQLRRLEEAAKRLNVTVTFTSLKEHVHAEFMYYGGGVLFAFLVVVLCSRFGLLLIYWMVVSIFKICQEDIRLLRVLGMPLNQLKQQLLLSVMSAPLVGLFLALLGIFILFPWRQLLVWDYLYLFGYQLVMLLIVSQLIKKQLGRFFHA